MDENILLILASGKSSRFGGYPKAFCSLKTVSVVQNTINQAVGTFKKVYLALNYEVYPIYKDKVYGCTIFAIETGLGDAHSLLKALRYVIQHERRVEKIAVCWGDAVFVNSKIFTKAAECTLDKDTLGMVLCSFDKNPYAWFDIKGDFICCAHFVKDIGRIRWGIHDQSLFLFRMPLIITYLETYREYLHITDEAKWSPQEEKEMKLLNSFTYFYEKNMLPMQYYIIEPNQVFSFNTKEELERIKKLVEI